MYNILGITLLDAIKKNDIKIVKYCLDNGADAKYKDSYALRYAAENGRVECVRLLIPVSDCRVFGSGALREAVYAGDTECVRLLIPVSDCKAMDSWALRYAAKYGHDEIVKMLEQAGAED